MHFNYFEYYLFDYLDLHCICLDFKQIFTTVDSFNVHKFYTIGIGYLNPI